MNVYPIALATNAVKINTLSTLDDIIKNKLQSTQISPNHPVKINSTTN